MPALLALHDVSYARARQRPGPAGFRLKEINLQIEAGDFCGILGANGSGKSTLARLCCGLYLPDSGEVIVEGYSTRQEENRRRIRRVVGLAFQNPDNQFVAETVAAETAFGLENLGVPPAEIRRRLREVLDRFDLGHLAGTPPHRLSGGEKRRLSLAALWVLRPRVLLLDEPLSMLDPGSKKKICGLLQELRREGTALLWFTPAFAEVARADHLLVLEAGKAVWQGRPGEFWGEVEKANRWGIELPPVYEIAAGICQSSPPPVASEEEFVSWLWK
ncbi:MAG: ATP-binding cassette domain-containing protein [Firmicutes bacterium]|nr:ATP-binding cassette domain-containing protein [Bacillota bacterium]